MRRLPVTAFIAGLALIFVVIGWRLYANEETARFHAVDAVRNSTSLIRMDLTIAYPHGAIASERYTLTDENGVSRADYAIANRRGTIATFHETIRGYDVSFTFDKMVQDGIWQLDSKRPRSPDSARYTIAIHQTAQNQSGSRTFSFTDPAYWAIAAGHQYHIRLDPNKPTPTQADLLRLESTSNAEPRYAQLVMDFRTFGSPTFHRTVAQARAKLLRS